jgi:hypothetical protein
LCFNLLVRAAWILVLPLGLAFPALPQGSAPASIQSPYLLRVALAVPHLNTCVLLRQDGGYHLERDYDDATGVYEGELASQELSRVQQWLENERLQKLSSDQIAEPLVVINSESLQLNVFRGDHRQDLFFPSSESQRPFHELLTPLLEWFNGLHNEPHRTVAAVSGRNNCMPPGRIELTTRPTSGTQMPAAAAEAGVRPGGEAGTSSNTAAPAFLMRLQYTRFEQREAQRTCAIVYTDGRYHLEKSTQQVFGPVRSLIHEASLEVSTLQGLRRLLDDRELKALQHGNIPDNPMFSATDTIRVWIPRDKDIQQLEFASDLRVQSAMGDHFVINDKNTRLVRPLQKWVLSELPADKATLIKGAVPNPCAAK